MNQIREDRPRPDPGPSSIELLSSAREGDAASLGEIYARFKPALLARIRTMLGPETRRLADSVDFLNGIFVEVMNDLDGRGELTDEQLLRWMTAVARNNIRDSARRRHEQAFGSLSHLIAAQGDPKGPGSQAAQMEHLHNLAQILEQLDERSREVLELHFFEEASFVAIGERIGCSDVHARYLLDKALIAVGRLMPSGD